MDRIKGIATCTSCGASATAGAELKHRFDCQLFEPKPLRKWQKGEPLIDMDDEIKPQEGL